MSAEDADSQCTDLFTTERDQCPTVDADVSVQFPRVCCRVCSRLSLDDIEK